MARVTTIITSIGSDSAESPNIDSTSWSTDSGTITLNSDLSASIFIGDTITDSAANTYLITGISGAVLTCQDFDTATDPATGAATIQEAYSTITLWEADLDVTALYLSSDDAQGEGYANAAFPESVVINGGTTVGLNSVTLQAAIGEENDGVEGSGFRIVSSAIALDVSRNDVTIVSLELDGNDANIVPAILEYSGPFTGGDLHRLLIYGRSGARTSIMRLVNFIGASLVANLNNSIIYNITNSNTGGSVGIFFFSGNALKLQNVVVHDINATHVSTGNAICITMPDEANHNYQNIVATDPSSNATAACYDTESFSNATVNHNLASDTTASGTGSLDSKTSANQFVSNSAPYDLHLKTGADAIDAGTDLGTTPVGVEIDIDGRDRDVEGDVWDMGADEFVVVGGVIIPIFFHHYQLMRNA